MLFQMPFDSATRETSIVTRFEEIFQIRGELSRVLQHIYRNLTLVFYSFIHFTAMNAS